MIRFFNGRTLSFGAELSITDDEVWTDGGKIVYVGKKRDDAPTFEREIDLDGDILMPGLKNAHTHSAMTMLRSMADDMPLHKWLNEQVFPREKHLTDEIVYCMTKLAILEYLSSGVTSAFDMYFHNDANLQACADTGFRMVICGSVNDFDADPTNMEREYLKYNNCHELFSYCFGIHAEYTTGLERLEYMASLANKYKAPLFSHNSETRAEVEGCIERYGMTPTKLFDSLGMYNYGGGGFHCLYLNDEDIEIFKRRGLHIVLNPASNLKLASGIAPVCRYLREGLNLALGTDGPASNNALDMFREMYLVTALQKYYEQDASACPAEEVLKMACVGSARAMGLQNCTDIAVGMKADLVVIDLHKPNMHPINNIAKNIVFSGSKQNVRLTMINGRILYENGEYFIGDDPERIYAEADKIAEAIR